MCSLSAPKDVSTILADQLYLSNLDAATSPDAREKFGITHILSVCPDFPSTGRNHLTLNVFDLEYENLLIQLPEAVQFIESALENKTNRVLVHCSLGVSRSPTVVCGYLMKRYKWSTSPAIAFVKERRRKVCPNSGFVKQLDAFEACDYDPTPSAPAYNRWKDAREKGITDFMCSVVEIRNIIPDQLFLNTNFRDTEDRCHIFPQLFRAFNMCHILFVTPSQPSPDGLPATTFRHVNVRDGTDDALLSVLPDILQFIHDILTAETDRKGRVLLHCQSVTRVYIVICAYLIYSRRISSKEAFSISDLSIQLKPVREDVMRVLEAFSSSLNRQNY